MNDVLMHRLSSDLNITKFEIETDDDYGNRLLYSALSAWARVQVLGKSYTDINEVCDTQYMLYHNIDIMHLHTHLSKVAYGMLSVLPHNKEWVKHGDLDVISSNIAKTITDQLLFCYEISRLGNRRLTTSPERTASFRNAILLLGGTSWQKRNSCSVGLGRWSCELQPVLDYKDIFCMPSCSIEQYYRSLIDNAIWRNGELTGTYQVFKTGTRGWYINAWVDFDNENISKGISLVKDTQTDGGYFLLKRINDVISCAQLDRWYVNENEIYRIMYALNAINNTHTIFYAKKNIDNILLHCHSILPNAEMRILLMSSWPLKTFDDIYKRIIPLFLWDSTVECLSSLGITVKFVEEI